MTIGIKLLIVAGILLFMAVACAFCWSNCPNDPTIESHWSLLGRCSLFSSLTLAIVGVFLL